jgi:hypothetical protein
VAIAKHAGESGCGLDLVGSGHMGRALRLCAARSEPFGGGLSGAAREQPAYSSEFMLFTSKGIPEEVAKYLREQIVEVDGKGDLRTSDRYRNVLDRYAVLLRYGFGLQVDRGATYWQELKKAQDLRDYYTHIKVAASRSISSAEVLDFMESVLLGIIVPSSLAKRTLMLNIFYLYDRWVDLSELTHDALPRGHVEQPFFHSAKMEGSFTSYCPFVSVDTDRFPNSDEERERHPT